MRETELETKTVSERKRPEEFTAGRTNQLKILPLQGALKRRDGTGIRETEPE